MQFWCGASSRPDALFQSHSGWFYRWYTLSRNGAASACRPLRCGAKSFFGLSPPPSSPLPLMLPSEWFHWSNGCIVSTKKSRPDMGLLCQPMHQPQACVCVCVCVWESLGLVFFCVSSRSAWQPHDEHQPASVPHWLKSTFLINSIMEIIHMSPDECRYHKDQLEPAPFASSLVLKRSIFFPLPRDHLNGEGLRGVFCELITNTKGQWSKMSFSISSNVHRRFSSSSPQQSCDLFSCSSSFTMHDRRFQKDNFHFFVA